MYFIKIKIYLCLLNLLQLTFAIKVFITSGNFENFTGGSGAQLKNHASTSLEDITICWRFYDKVRLDKTLISSMWKKSNDNKNIHQFNLYDWFRGDGFKQYFVFLFSCDFKVGTPICCNRKPYPSYALP